MSDILWQALADAYIRGAQCVHDDHAKLIDWKADAAPIATEYRNQIIRELMEKVYIDAANICQERYLPDERAKVLRYLGEWLTSQLEGGE